MHRFWSRYSGPLIEAIAPRRIVEIGAEFGWNTRHLLDYCRRTNAFLDIIEPLPLQSLRDQLSPYGENHFCLHVGKSWDCIPTIAVPDVVMLDGDHNWRTVFTELSLLRTRAESSGQPMPIVLAHDCAWPYARRDMYYDPDAFREVHRQPYAYKGILPGISELVDNGVNAQFANALTEGGPENGVLTAIEDFVAANEGIKLWTLPFFNGLGIVAPDARLTPSITEVIESFYEPDALLQTCETIELEGMRLRAEMLTERRILEQRTEALERARDVLRRRAQRIAELEAQLQAVHAA